MFHLKVQNYPTMTINKKKTYKMHYNDQTQIPNFYIGPGIRANVFFDYT